MFLNVLNHKGILYICVKQGVCEQFIKREEYNGREKFFSFYTPEELKDLIKSTPFKIFQEIIEKKRDTWINLFARKE